MKVSAIISNPGRDIIKAMNNNKSSVMSALVIACGIIIGVLLYVFNSDTLSGDLWDYFIRFSVDFSHKTKLEIFSGLVIPDLIYLIVMTILGTCAVGTLAVICLTLINSMGLGMLTAYIYDTFALKGIEYCLLVFLPGKFLLIMAMIMLTQNCAVTSKDIKNSVCNRADRVVDFQKYGIRIFVIILVLLLSDIVDFITVTGFSSLFNFS